MVSVDGGQEQLGWGFWLSVSPEVSFTCQLSVPVAGGPVALVASSQARLTGGCCWQRPPPLNPAHLSTELFGVLTQWPLAFKGVSEPRGQGES